MRILAFDTATRATTVALVGSDGSQVTEARDDPDPGSRPRHTSLLLALITDVLQRAGCGWEGVERIAVGVGPGTFTGLRIGVATARALAQARGIALVGVSTLESLVLAAADATPDLDAVLAVLDARRGEVFAAAWTSEVTAQGDSGAGRPLLEPVAIAPPRLAEAATGLGRDRLAIGEGAVEFRTVLERPGTVIPPDKSPLHLVNARYHCRLASGTHPAGRDDVRPEYLRLPDAELSLRAAKKR